MQAAIQDLMDVTVTPLSPACGAEISGVDLTKPLSPERVGKTPRPGIQGPTLSEDQQLRFASYFGDLGRRKKAPEPLRGRAEGIYQTNEKVLLVSNIKVDGAPIGAFGEGEFWFHIDSGYSARPYRYTFLHALELPSTGGNTMFSNMYKAYEAVPERLKQKLRGKKALHVHEYKRSEKADISGDISGIPHHYHPVFITFSVRCETNPRPHSEEVTCSLLRVTVSKNGRTRVARPVSLCAAGARRLMSRN